MIDWFEIPVNDMPRARSFYERIFNVRLQHLKLGDGFEMGIFPQGGALVLNRAFYKPGEEGPLLYLNGNPDLQSLLDQVKASGGEVLIPKRQISEERGYMAVFRDTEGNRIALRSDG